MFKSNTSLVCTTREENFMLKVGTYILNKTWYLGRYKYGTRNSDTRVID